MRNKYVSIKQLKCHEFHTTLRKLDRKENLWIRRFDILSEIEANATQHFVKMSSFGLLAYLLVTSLRTEELLQLKIQNFEVSIPVTYFLTAASFLFLLIAVSFCHLSVAMSLKARESGKIILPGFSASIYGLLRGKKDDLSLGLPVYSNFFIKERIPVSGFLGFTLLAGILAMLIPLVSLGVFLFREQYGLLFAKVPIVEMISVFFGCLLISFSGLYVVLFHLPLPTKKNLSHIRFSFLIYLTQSLHPRSKDWLD